MYVKSNTPVVIRPTRVLEVAVYADEVRPHFVLQPVLDGVQEPLVNVAPISGQVRWEVASSTCGVWT